MKQWEKIIKDFEKATGTTVSGFDPSISGYDKDGMNTSFQIPLWLAERVIALAKKKK
jgi:hypothetical protein